MKFDPKFRIEDVASRDETRAHLIAVELDVKKKRLVATDGHCMAYVPCEVDTDDRSGPIPVAAMREARRTFKRMPPEPLTSALPGPPRFKPAQPTIRARKRVLDVNKSVMYRRPEGGRFPRYEQVIPDVGIGADGTHSVTLNPELLLRTAKALGWTPGRLVTITQKTTITKTKDGSADALEPIVVRGDSDDAIGVVMPGRR